MMVIDTPVLDNADNADNADNNHDFSKIEHLKISI